MLHCASKQRLQPLLPLQLSLFPVIFASLKECVLFAIYLLPPRVQSRLKATSWSDKTVKCCLVSVIVDLEMWLPGQISETGLVEGLFVLQGMEFETPSSLWVLRQGKIFLGGLAFSFHASVPYVCLISSTFSLLS